MKRLTFILFTCLLVCSCKNDVDELPLAVRPHISQVYTEGDNICVEYLESGRHIQDVEYNIVLCYTSSEMKFGSLTKTSIPSLNYQESKPGIEKIPCFLTLEEGLYKIIVDVRINYTNGYTDNMDNSGVHYYFEISFDPTKR